MARESWEFRSHEIPIKIACSPACRNLPMNTYRERVSKIICPDKSWTIRVWRMEPLTSAGDFKEGQQDEDVLKVISIGFTQFKNISQIGLAESILKLDRVNAVEVVDSYGMGEVCYKDWP